MALQVITPHFSCVVQEIYELEGQPGELDQAIAEGYQDIYIVTPGGVFRHQRFRDGKDGLQRFLRTEVKGVPGFTLPKFKKFDPVINFLPEGKIPTRLLEQVKTFFKDVIKKRGSAVEAMIWILWNQDAGYHLFVPNQKVQGASVTYDWGSVPSGSSIIVDIHSHANFGAFFSGTDNADDRGSLRYSGVIGHNLTDKQDMVWRFNCQPDPKNLTLEDIFQEPITPEMETPSEWLDKVDTSSGYQTYHGKHGNNYGHGSGYQSPGYSHPDPTGWSNYQNNRGGGSSSSKTEVKEEDGQRVWKGSQHGRLNNGPWSKSNNVYTPSQMQAALIGEGFEGIEAEPDIKMNSEGALVVTTKPTKAEKRQAKRDARSEKKDSKSSTDADTGPESLVKSFIEERELAGADENVIMNLTEYFQSEEFRKKNQIEKNDFKDRVFDYGTDAAIAADDVTQGLEQLKGSDDLLTEVSAKAFGLLSETEKLDAFRRLYSELPKAAQETLATSGF